MALVGEPVLSQTESAPPAPDVQYTLGVVWVKLSREARAEAVAAGRWESCPVAQVVPDISWVKVLVGEGEEMAAIDRLRLQPGVLWAEPDYIVHIASIPDDPSYGSQWNMDKVQAPFAWDMVQGSVDVTIAVIDTGVDLEHPDLQGNLWQNFGEIADNGVDDDGNGYVDDRWGWDVCNWDPLPQDDHGHGTHVAGIAGAVGNNGVGVAGVMWRCSIMAVKVLDRGGDGTYSDVAAGIRYAVNNGARIVNMSLAGSSYSKMLQDTINEMCSHHDVLFVAAAGNCGAGGSGCSGVNPIMYPAAMEHVVSVAFTDSSDRRAYNSEYNEFVDLAAPGVYVYSTFLGGGYTRLSGTSMATPLVSGLAGLVRVMRPYWIADQTEAHLKATAEKIGNDLYADGRNDYYGYGRVNAATAVWTLDPPRLAVSDEQLDLRAQSGVSVTAAVTLTNSSAALTEWHSQIISGEDWLSVSPTSGVVSVSSPVTLTMQVAEDAPAGPQQGVVQILSDNPYLEGEPPQIEVDVWVADEVLRLFFPVIFVQRE